MFLKLSVMFYNRTISPHVGMKKSANISPLGSQSRSHFCNTFSLSVQHANLYLLWGLRFSKVCHNCNFFPSYPTNFRTCSLSLLRGAVDSKFSTLSAVIIKLRGKFCEFWVKSQGSKGLSGSISSARDPCFQEVTPEARR